MSAWKGQEENTGICKKCAELIRKKSFPDTEEEQDIRFFSVLRTTASHEQTVQLVAADIVRAIQTRQKPKEVDKAVSNSMREITTRTVAQISFDRGGWTLQSLLPFEGALALSKLDDVQFDPDAYERWSKLLTVDDWYKALRQGFAKSSSIAAEISKKLRSRIISEST